jgi:DNA-binding response OmpR family regulator
MAIVLIVTDQRPDRSPITRRLCDEGYHTLTAEDCPTAVATLNCIRADVLVVDVPSVNGDLNALLAKVRADASYNDVPVFLLGSRGGNDAREAITPNTRTFVMQYLALDDLVARVRSHIEPLTVPYN